MKVGGGARRPGLPGAPGRPTADCRAVPCRAPRPQPGSQAAADYTALVRETAQALRAAAPGAATSVDVPWSPYDVDGRNYDWAGLAAAADLLFIMAYDTASQVGRGGQAHRPRDVKRHALSPALCTTPHRAPRRAAQIPGRCIAGANSPLDVVRKGVTQWLQIGVPRSKLVLGLPWCVRARLLPSAPSELSRTRQTAAAADAANQTGTRTTTPASGPTPRRRRPTTSTCAGCSPCRSAAPAAPTRPAARSATGRYSACSPRASTRRRCAGRARSRARTSTTARATARSIRSILTTPARWRSSTRCAAAVAVGRAPGRAGTRRHGLPACLLPRQVAVDAGLAGIGFWNLDCLDYDSDDPLVQQQTADMWAAVRGAVEAFEQQPDGARRRAEASDEQPPRQR